MKKVREIRTPVRFRESFVSFIDLLGFGEYILGAVARPEEKIARVERIYAAIRHAIHGAQSGGVSVRQSIFSDSIILSTPCDGDAEKDRLLLQSLIWCVRKIFLAVLAEGFLSRGAIVRNTLYHDERMVLGPGLVQAYHLEQRTAVYPRVIVTGNARELLQDLEPGWIISGGDGPFFVDVLSDLHRIVAESTNSGWKAFEQSDAFRLIKKCAATIEIRLAQSRDNPEAFKKNKWFAIYFNRSILEIGWEDKAAWPKPIPVGDYDP